MQLLNATEDNMDGIIVEPLPDEAAAAAAAAGGGGGGGGGGGLDAGDIIRFIQIRNVVPLHPPYRRIAALQKDNSSNNPDDVRALKASHPFLFRDYPDVKQPPRPKMM